MVEMMDNYLCLISGEYGMMNNSRIYFMEKIDRIVYPVSDTYNDIKSRDVHLSYVYGIDL